MAMTPTEARQILDEVLKRGKCGNAYVPTKPTKKQKEFLDLMCFEAAYGGAAGGGKSEALLMGACDYLHIPGYSALLLRRTFKDLSLPGALLDRARSWFSRTDAHWIDKEKRWNFPSGASITFGYLQTEADKYQYQSSEFQYIGFDEATQFSETQYTYLLSRIRKIKSIDVPLRVRCASNPGGTGHEWFKRRFIDRATKKEREFVPALLEDNPHLDAESYERSLIELDSTTYAQLRKGVWVKDTHGLVYHYNYDINAIPKLPPKNDFTYVHSVDLGTSEKKPTTAFCVIAFHKDIKSVFVVKTTVHAAMTPSKIADHLRQLQIEYPPERTVIDAGGLGLGYISEFQTRFGIACQAAQKRDKLGYRKLCNGDLEKGRIKIAEQDNAILINEFNNVAWNEKGDDADKGQDTHATDAFLYGWREARHWLSEEPIAQPKAGTTEYWQQQAAEMKARKIQQQKEGKKRWWQKSPTRPRWMNNIAR